MARRLRNLNRIVVVAVHGSAVGAGFALTLAADARLCSHAASFHIGAIMIGLTSGECGVSHHVPRLVGTSRAFEMMLTGRLIAAKEAERIGLVCAVVDKADLLDRALAIARQVLQDSPYATRHTMHLVWANLDPPSLDAALQLENRAQVMALMTEDFREAVAAFVDKRAHAFRNR